MASLYTHIFAHRAALHRTSFRHSLVGATRPLWKTSVLSAPRASSRPLNNRAAASRVAAAVRWSGTGLASAGLALSLYNNSQNLNCERGSIHPRLTTNFMLRTGTAGTASSPQRSKWERGSSDLSPDLPPPPQSSVNMYELTFGTVCGVCAGIFVKKGAKALAFFFGGVFVLLQVSPPRTYWNAICREPYAHAHPQIVSWLHINNQNRLVNSCCSLRGVILYYGEEWDQTPGDCLLGVEMADRLFNR